jgi:hypothetical protein
MHQRLPIRRSVAGGAVSDPPIGPLACSLAVLAMAVGLSACGGGGTKTVQNPVATQAPVITTPPSAPTTPTTTPTTTTPTPSVPATRTPTAARDTTLACLTQHKGVTGLQAKTVSNTPSLFASLPSGNHVGLFFFPNPTIARAQAVSFHRRFPQDETDIDNNAMIVFVHKASVPDKAAIGACIPRA